MLYTQFCNSPNLCLLVYQTTSCIYAALWLLQPLRRVSRSWGSSLGATRPLVSLPNIALHHRMWQDLPGTSPFVFHYYITSPHVMTRSPRDFPHCISLLHYITACDDKISQGLLPLYFITSHVARSPRDFPLRISLLIFIHNILTETYFVFYYYITSLHVTRSPRDFPLCICILEVMKQWRPGNGVSFIQTILFGIASLKGVICGNILLLLILESPIPSLQLC